MTTPFDLWWSWCPRKVKKIRARVAYDKAVKLVGHDVLLSTIKAYRTATNGWKPEDRKYIPYPATLLNDGYWDDDQAEWVDTEQQAVQAKQDAEKRRWQRIQEENDKRTAESAAIEASIQTPENRAARQRIIDDFGGGLTSASKDVP